MKQTRLMAVVTATLLAGFVQASGFGLYEASARGNAMGNALVGRTGDASAVYYNPANMTQNPGLQFMAGITLINPHSEFAVGSSAVNSPGGAKLEEAWFNPIHAYATWQINDRIWVGFGEYSEYGLGTEYSDPYWVGAYNAMSTTLETITLNPSIAFKITDRLSIGAGFRALYADFQHKRQLGIPNAMPLGQMDIAADGWGYGYNIGLSYAITDTIDFGLTYRSQMKLKLNGEANRDSHGASIPVSPAPGVVVKLPVYDHTRSPGEAEITLPSSITAGLNWQITPAWSLGGVVTWTEWSTFDALNIYFDRPTVQGPNSAINSGTESLSTKNWNDVYRFGLGTEYRINENWAVQGGYVYDMAPQDKQYCDFMIPPGNRHMFGIGGTYTTGAWSISLSYNYMILVQGSGYADMAPNAEGSIPTRSRSAKIEMSDAYSHFIGCSVSYKF